MSDTLTRLANTSYMEFITIALDIIIVAVIIYELILFLKGTRAWQIAVGLGFFALLVVVSDLLNLRALSSLLKVFVPLGPVALVILFFPEMRNMLEQLGRLKFFGQSYLVLGREDIDALVENLTQAVVSMSKSKTGALIVLEREVGLDNIIANGVAVNAAVTDDLIRTIFYTGSPLHDGAVIIRGNRIVAAGCILPLSENKNMGMLVHTRHKAAIGVSELSDATVLVVSEETGTISISSDGELERGLSESQIREKLLDLYKPVKPADEKVQIKRIFSNTINKLRTNNGSKTERKQ